MLNLLIVGAGPAGLAAAVGAAEQGLSVKVIDEFPKPGGRLLGQLHQEPGGEWWNGIEKSAELEERALQAGAEIECGISVYDISFSCSGWLIHTNHGDVSCEKLLLATGAAESPNPVKGWTLPGVMSIGAAQVMGNVHRVKPGNTCIIIGANVLSMAIANELRMCGVKVKQIIIPQSDIISKDEGVPKKVIASLMNLTHLAPSPMLRFLGKIGKKVPPAAAIRFFPKKGIKMFGIPVRIKTAAIEITGETEVEGVRTADVSADGKINYKTEKVVEADFVCISGRLTPLAELASVIGCSFKYVPELGGHVPVHDEKMQTNVPDLFVAGNLTGIESAKVAMAQGKVAGLTIAADVLDREEQLQEAIKKAAGEVRSTREKALIQFHPDISYAREKFYQEFSFDHRENKKKEAKLS